MIKLGGINFPPNYYFVNQLFFLYIILVAILGGKKYGNR